MRRTLIVLCTALLTLVLASCTLQMGYPEDFTSTTTVDSNLKAPATTTPKQTTTVKTVSTTTKKPDTPEQKPQTTTDGQPKPPATTTTKKPDSTHPFKDETVTVTYPAKTENGGKTYSGLPPMADVTYTVVDPLNKLGISTQSFAHSFGAAKDGKPHHISVDNQARFDEYGYSTLTWDNKTEEKVLYLTFDCGYEYKNFTSLILDTLKEKDVPATFFCTLPFLKEVPETVARMINEGHNVGNHSVTHPSDCSALSREELAKELLGVHNHLRVNFGYESKYFRFPSGKYAPNSLELVQSIGYRSVFWSIAHADYDTENQPGVDKSFQTVSSRLHPGAVILLHSCSSDNVEMLADLIDYARAQGYEFRSLDDYEYWDQ
ncbi:MAG: polysaccharide deacetylase family protein [Clostridia bacterium]|nr:polysaccharide deacetylase family protein [Clostridia bacterium]